MWNPELETFDFGSRHPVRIGRFQMIRDFVETSGFLEKSNVVIMKPTPLSEELLGRIHSQEYIQMNFRVLIIEWNDVILNICTQ
jgi:acetoin utilization deacetylase AcuC-like enzyme